MADVKKTRSEVLETEFCSEFISGMQDRMVVSYYKYGPVKDSFGKIDNVKSLLLRLVKYCGTQRLYDILGTIQTSKGDGNTEWLMDAGNFTMMEYMAPSHPRAHYHPTDSGASPGRAWVPDEGEVVGEVSKRANDYSPEVG